MSGLKSSSNFDNAPIKSAVPSFTISKSKSKPKQFIMRKGKEVYSTSVKLKHSNEY
jgi:hypothetical protein